MPLHWFARILGRGIIIENATYSLVFLINVQFFVVMNLCKHQEINLFEFSWGMSSEHITLNTAPFFLWSGWSNQDKLDSWAKNPILTGTNVAINQLPWRQALKKKSKLGAQNWRQAKARKNIQQFSIFRAVSVCCSKKRNRRAVNLLHSVIQWKFI